MDFFWSTCQQTICIIFTLTNLIYCNGFPFSFNFLIILKSAKFTLKGLIFIWNLNRWEAYQPLTLASQFLYVKLKLFGPINEKKGHYYCKIHNKLFHTNYSVFELVQKGLHVWSCIINVCPFSHLFCPKSFPNLV